MILHWSLSNYLSQINSKLYVYGLRCSPKSMFCQYENCFDFVVHLTFKKNTQKKCTWFVVFKSHWKLKVSISEMNLFNRIMFHSFSLLSLHVFADVSEIRIMVNFSFNSKIYNKHIQNRKSQSKYDWFQI